MASDAKRAELAKLVDTSLARIEECAQVLFTDLPYALLRAKMIAEMVINAKCVHRAAAPGRRRRRAPRPRRGLHPPPRDRERVDGEAHRAEPRRPPRTRRADPRELRRQRRLLVAAERTNAAFRPTSRCGAAGIFSSRATRCTRRAHPLQTCRSNPQRTRNIRAARLAVWFRNRPRSGRWPAA